MLSRPHVVLAGGGAQGDLYPGLAIAQRLADLCPSLTITFAGCGEAEERHAVQAAGHGYLSVPSKRIPRSPLEGIRFVTDNAAGYWASRWMLGEQHASLVVGLGGPVAAVMALAPHSRGIPLVLLEQNAKPSRTTRSMGPYAQAVCLAFDEARAHLPVNTPALVTGTPVREEFFAPQEDSSSPYHDSPEQASAENAEQKQLLIIGGAKAVQAQTLNERVPCAIARLGEEFKEWRLVHQAGEGQLQATERRYQQAGVEGVVVSHIDQMPSLLRSSNLVISRAGGALLAELAATGVPAIVVPRPLADEQAQAANAKAMQRHGACAVLDEQAAEPLEAQLARWLSQLLHNDIRRAQMAQAMRATACPNAAEQIATLCVEILGLATARVAA